MEGTNKILVNMHTRYLEVFRDSTDQNIYNMINTYGKNCFAGLKLIDQIYKKDHKLHENMIHFLVVHINTPNPNGLLMYLNKYKYEDLIVQYLENREYDVSVFQVLDKKYLQYGLISENENIYQYIYENYQELDLAQNVALKLILLKKYDAREKYYLSDGSFSEKLVDKFIYQNFDKFDKNQLEYMMNLGFNLLSNDNIIFRYFLMEENEEIIRFFVQNFDIDFEDGLIKNNLMLVDSDEIINLCQK